MGGDGLLGLCGHDKIFCLTPGSLASLRASSVRLSSVKSQSGIPLGTTDGRGRSWIGHDHIPVSPLISVGVSVSIHRPARVSLSLSLSLFAPSVQVYTRTLYAHHHGRSWSRPCLEATQRRSIVVAKVGTGEWVGRPQFADTTGFDETDTLSGSHVAFFGQNVEDRRRIDVDPTDETIVIGNLHDTQVTRDSFKDAGIGISRPTSTRSRCGAVPETTTGTRDATG